MTRKTAAVSSTTPITTGMSRLVIAWSTSEPMPGRPKTVSTSTAPPSSEPESQPVRVTSGTAACRSVCRSSTAVRLRPRDRAVTVNGWPSAASRLSRSTCASTPATGSASVSAGSTSEEKFCAPATGKTCNWKEKTVSSTIPVQ